MKPYPPPTSEGFYWAKLIHPSEMPPKEDWASSDWEIVQVWDNNGEGDEAFGVSVFGVPKTQWIPDFVWGPRITKPTELKS